MRICEIEDELRKLEVEQEEADECMMKLLHNEEDTCQVLQGYIRTTVDELGDFHTDAQLTQLLEEKFHLLKCAQHDCDTLVTELYEDQKKLKERCTTTLTELEDEKQLLEVIPV